MDIVEVLRLYPDSIFAEDAKEALHLIEALQRETAAWHKTALQHHKNEEFYRGLLVQIGEIIGHEAYVSDDALCLKLPDLVRALKAEGRK